MEEALIARLLADSAVTSLVGERINWIERPQDEGFPAITLQVIDRDYAQHMTGLQKTQFALVQVDVWALGYLEATQIEEAVVNSLLPEMTINGVKFGRAFVRSRDLSERTETQFIFRPSMDFTINYSAQ